MSKFETFLLLWGLGGWIMALVAQDYYLKVIKKLSERLKRK